MVPLPPLPLVSCVMPSRDGRSLPCRPCGTSPLKRSRHHRSARQPHARSGGLALRALPARPAASPLRARGARGNPRVPTSGLGGEGPVPRPFPGEDAIFLDQAVRRGDRLRAVLALLRSERDTQAICQGPARGGMEPADAAVRQARGCYGQEGTSLTTPRPEGPGFQPSRARVPVSLAPAPGNVRSRGPQPKSYSASAGIGAVPGTYGTTCRICLTGNQAYPRAPSRTSVTRRKGGRRFLPGLKSGVSTPQS